MLPHPTLDKLQTLRLHGMLKALNEQLKTPDIDSLSFEERLGLLVDRELTERDDKRLSSRLRQARLKHNACLEDIDYRSPRGLDKALILQLSGGQWLRDGLNLIIGGPTGVGKTWLACALAHQACREGYSVRYLRLPRLLEELGLAHGDGRFAKLMSSYAKTDLLILDDWGLAPFTAEQRRDMLELLDDRYGQRSTIVTSQMPVDNWHELIGDPTLADAILDRLVHNAYRINLKGESMRKRTQKLTTPANPGRMAVEQVARWPWNAWPDESGLGGRMAWNPHTHRAGPEKVSQEQVVDIPGKTSNDPRRGDEEGVMIFMTRLGLFLN